MLSLAMDLASGTESTRHSACPFRVTDGASPGSVGIDTVDMLLCQANCLGASGGRARERGDEAEADEYFRDALRLALSAVNRTENDIRPLARLSLLKSAAAQGAAPPGTLRAARLDVLVSVTAEVARDYFELRGLQNQLAVARRNAGVQTETLTLTLSFLEGGRGRSSMSPAVSRCST